MGLYSLIKWDEFQNDKILVSKVLPMQNKTTLPSALSSFYYADSITNSIFKNVLFPVVSSDWPRKDGFRIRIYGNMTFLLSERLSLQHEYEFDNKGENDSHFLGRERG